MDGKHDKTNGNANANALFSGAPRAIADLADACIRFVERAIHFKLDLSPETLPVLDHYVEQARQAAHEKPETIALVAPAIGAYLGEVIRQHFGGYWRLEDEKDPRSFRVELEPVYLILRPIELITRALSLPHTPEPAKEDSKQEKNDDDEDNEDEDENTLDAKTAQAPKPTTDPSDDINAAILELDEDDRQTIADKLVTMPPIPDTEYYAPTTYLEIADLIVETLRAKRSADGMEPDAHLEPADYSS